MPVSPLTGPVRLLFAYSSVRVSPSWHMAPWAELVYGFNRSFESAGTVLTPSSKDVKLRLGITPLHWLRLAVSEAAVVGAAGDLDRALDQLQGVVAAAVAAGDPINEVRARMVVAALLVRAGRGPA